MNGGSSCCPYVLPKELLCWLRGSRTTGHQVFLMRKEKYPMFLGQVRRPTYHAQTSSICMARHGKASKLPNVSVAGRSAAFRDKTPNALRMCVCECVCVWSSSHKLTPPPSLSPSSPSSPPMYVGSSLCMRARAQGPGLGATWLVGPS